MLQELALASIERRIAAQKDEAEDAIRKATDLSDALRKVCPRDVDSLPLWLGLTREAASQQSVWRTFSGIYRWCRVLDGRCQCRFRPR